MVKPDYIRIPIFLVYDSRSGSTLLSRILNSRLKNTSVSREVGFEEVLKQSDTNSKRKWLSTLEKTKKNHDLRNSKVDIDGIKHLVEKKTTASKRAVFNAVLSSVIEEYPCKNVIIKNGRHIKYLKELNFLLGNKIKIIYIHRDPRAVISSKLNTPRPYYPKESMAWGGAMMAALQWKKYAQYISDYPVSDHILNVSFEELIENQEEVLKKIASFINDELVIKTATAYKLPKMEAGIHKLVSKKLDKSRLEAWRKELTTFQLRQIECILGKSHLTLTKKNKMSPCFIIKIISIIEITLKAGKHYAYHILKRILEK